MKNKKQKQKFKRNFIIVFKNSGCFSLFLISLEDHKEEINDVINALITQKDKKIKKISRIFLKIQGISY